MENISDLNHKYDPKCPGCGAVHPRTFVNSTFMVKTDQDWLKQIDGIPADIKSKKGGEHFECKWRGTLTEKDFLSGRKR
jgi:hypothetical protein